MTHVVAKPCFACKYTDCVVVCPVECFYEGEQMLYIHPDECIDCEACVPECPVDAIFHEDNVPDEWKDFTQLNAEMAPQCPQITEKKEPLAGESPESSSAGCCSSHPALFCGPELTLTRLRGLSMIRRLVQKAASPKDGKLFGLCWIEAALLAEISGDGG